MLGGELPSESRFRQHEFRASPQKAAFLLKPLIDREGIEFDGLCFINPVGRR